MPKRATHTFESEKDGIQETALGVQYCMCCGESVLILGPETVLSDLPRRRTDGALVLERGSTVFKLNTKEMGSKVLKRAGGRYERQYRFACWNCGIFLGYRAEPSEDARLTYLLPDATGQQADLYLQMYQVPPCIQPTGDRSVRIALDVLVGKPKRALTHVSESEVGVCVCAPSREGLANAELLEFMAKVLAVTKPQLHLSRGWSANSKFLAVSGLQPVDIFKRLKAAVDTDVILPVGPEASSDAPANFSAGVASGVARRHWEEGETFDELAEAPTTKQQVFIK